MPQANDAELTELYTASTGVDVEDNEPNTGAPGNPPSNTFDLHLQAVAGNALGGSGANYSLRADCIDETLAAPNPGMSVGPLNQQFNGADGWVAATSCATWPRWSAPTGTSCRSWRATSSS